MALVGVEEEGEEQQEVAQERHRLFRVRDHR